MADRLTWLDIVLSAALAAWASPEEDLALTAKALEQNLDLAPFRRLFLRFEGDEDLAPRVRAISGYQTLAGIADRRR